MTLRISVATERCHFEESRTPRSTIIVCRNTSEQTEEPATTNPLILHGLPLLESEVVLYTD